MELAAPVNTLGAFFPTTSLLKMNYLMKFPLAILYFKLMIFNNETHIDFNHIENINILAQNLKHINYECI